MSWSFITEAQAASKLHLDVECLRRGIAERKIRGPQTGEGWTTDLVHQLVGDRYFHVARQKLVREWEAEQSEKNLSAGEKRKARALALGLKELERLEKQERELRAAKAAELIGGSAEDYLDDGGAE